MKHPEYAFAVFLLLLFPAACADDNRSAGNNPGAVKADAVAAVREFASAISAGNLERAGKIYDGSGDFYWIDRGRLQYENAAGARNSLLSFAGQDAEISMVLEETHATALGTDAALVSARYSLNVTCPDAAAPECQSYGFSGWMTMGMLKRPEGWRIAGGHAGPSAGQ